jgi:hypothetical protein
MKLNWGQGIFLFFVVFISLGISFVIFSLRQNNDLVTNDYYEKGADYTRQMEINSRSIAYIDSINLVNQNDLLIARFSKSIDMMTDTMDVFFFRPSDKRFDHEFRMALKSDSIEIVKSGIQKGRYKVKFQWANNLEVFMVEKEFFVE